MQPQKLRAFFPHPSAYVSSRVKPPSTEATPSYIARWAKQYKSWHEALLVNERSTIGQRAKHYWSACEALLVNERNTIGPSTKQ